MDFTQILNNFASVPVYVTVVYCLAVYRKLPKTLKVFSIFLFVSGVIQLVSEILWSRGENNLPLLHIYVAGGFVALARFYEVTLDEFIDKRIIRGISIAFLCFTAVNSAFIQPIKTFNSYALTVESILIVILAFTTYMVMMDDIVRKKRQELSSSLNWINSGLFIYYASSLIIFFYSETLYRFFPDALNIQTWTLHAVFSLVMYLCFFVGIWRRPPVTTSDE